MDTNKLRMQNLKVTSLKSNRRVILPKQLEDAKEHDIMKLQRMVNSETKAYKRKYYNENNKDVNEKPEITYAKRKGNMQREKNHLN